MFSLISAEHTGTLYPRFPYGKQDSKPLKQMYHPLPLQLTQFRTNNFLTQQLAYLFILNLLCLKFFWLIVDQAMHYEEMSFYQAIKINMSVCLRASQPSSMFVSRRQTAYSSLQKPAVPRTCFISACNTC